MHCSMEQSNVQLFCGYSDRCKSMTFIVRAVRRGRGSAGTGAGHQVGAGPGWSGGRHGHPALSSHCTYICMWRRDGGGTVGH